jgi:hypothetical protein
LIAGQLAKEHDEETVKRAEELLSRYLDQVGQENLSQLLEGVRQPSIRGRAAYIQKLLEHIESELSAKESPKAVRHARRAI